MAEGERWGRGKIREQGCTPSTRRPTRGQERSPSEVAFPAPPTSTTPSRTADERGRPGADSEPLSAEQRRWRRRPRPGACSGASVANSRRLWCERGVEERRDPQRTGPCRGRTRGPRRGGGMTAGASAGERRRGRPQRWHIASRAAPRSTHRRRAPLVRGTGWIAKAIPARLRTTPTRAGGRDRPHDHAKNRPVVGVLDHCYISHRILL